MLQLTRFSAFVLAIGLGLPFAASAVNLTIEQTSPAGKYSDWVLEQPNGLNISTRNTANKTLTNVDLGAYTLKVDGPAGVNTTISGNTGLGGTVISTKDRRFDFGIDGTNDITINIDHAYASVVTVTSEPAGANFELKSLDGTVRYLGVTPATLEDLAPLTYRITYGYLESCQPAKSQTRYLHPSFPLRFHADYICDGELTRSDPLHGDLVGNPLLPPSPANRPDQVNVRIWHQFHQTEAVAGSSVLVTLGVRNLDSKTLHNVSLAQQYDPNQVSLSKLLPQSGLLNEDQATAMWLVPKIFAGQSWSVTFPVQLSKSLTTGDTARLNARVWSPDIYASDGELLAHSTRIGIATMPRTGFDFTWLFLAISTLVALTLTLTIHRNSPVASTV